MAREEFADLPDALVRDLLTIASPVAAQVKEHLSGLVSSTGALREAARTLIGRKADLERPREPSIAAVDGSYQIHSLTSIDICAAAAVAVEGTTRNATRYWPEPYHRMWAGGVQHSVDATGVLRGLMVAMEMDLACNAPHDIIMLDGSFGSLIIYLNQGLSLINQVPEPLGKELAGLWHDQHVMSRLLSLLGSDKVMAVPKFTSRNELSHSEHLSGIPAARATDGRTLATLILEPGEYTKPLPTYVDDDGQAESYHLPSRFTDPKDQDTMNAALAGVRSVYFRPFGWVPAIRLELPAKIANSSMRLSMVLEGVESQFFSPAVIEPYPLFIADRMVKSLGAGVSVLEQTVAQYVVDGGIDVQTSILCMQNFRTEGGRGGIA